jgi:hypothetical protein
LPLAVTTHAANHHEVTLVQLTTSFHKVGLNLSSPRPSLASLLGEFLRHRQQPRTVAGVAPHSIGDRAETTTLASPSVLTRTAGPGHLSI